MNEHENKYSYGKLEITYKGNETDYRNLANKNLEELLDFNVIVDGYDEKIPLEFKGKVSLKFRIYVKLCRLLKKLLYGWRYE